MRLVIFGLLLLLVSACAPSTAPTVALVTLTPSFTPTPILEPAWFRIPMKNVNTGQTFTIHDFKGKVVLVEVMATWCPNCLAQEEQVNQLHAMLSDPEDFVSVSLDTDLNEDETLLGKYLHQWQFPWYFAIAPLPVDHDLGNLYNAEYLNPPLAPMLLIDRRGIVFGLPYGIKTAEDMKKTIQKYLAE
jgi:thiol-disulfide isomerase/thioredoxin